MTRVGSTSWFCTRPPTCKPYHGYLEY